MVCEEKAAGASFVVIDNPEGDKQTSPITIKKKLRTNHIGFTKEWVPLIKAGIIITKNDKPANSNPIANFLPLKAASCLTLSKSMQKSVQALR